MSLLYEEYCEEVVLKIKISPHVKRLYMFIHTQEYN